MRQAPVNRFARPETLVAAALSVLVSLASAARPARGERGAAAVRVVAFSGVSTVPLRIAAAQGLFAGHGLAVTVDFTPNSRALRDGLAGGRYDVAHAAVDNAVAMVETAGADVVILMGGDDSMNELIARPEVTSIAALRGRTVIVDAPDTAYALQVKKILGDRGLLVGRDYTLKAVGGTPQRWAAMRSDPACAASMLNPPYSLLAAREGFTRLGSAAELLGAYQGMGAFARRAWAQAHRDTVVRYLAAYIEALRWFLDPEHQAAATELLMEELAVPRDIAEQTYALAVASPGGLAPDARLDLDGLRQVLKLRAEVEGQWEGTPPPPERYSDLSYHEAALARLAARRRSPHSDANGTTSSSPDRPFPRAR
jgi:ABC-type nitrate/sulfonate/bicarbonate transport system substrate-binding protein